MENKETLDYLRFQRILNTLLGLPLYTCSWDQFGPKTEFFLKSIYQRFGEMIVVLVTIGQLWAIPYISEDINVLCGCLSSATHCSQLIAKTTLLTIQKDRFTSHLKKAHELQQETLTFKMLICQEKPDFDDFQKQRSRLGDNFKELICPYLLFEFSYVVIHTCVPAFVITSTFSWTTLQKMAVFCMIGGAIITLYLMCNAGDVFCAEWDDSKNVLFNFELAFKEGKWIKDCYFMIQQRLQKPFRLSVFNVSPLNCVTFLNISKLIFSYYMTLNQIQQMKRTD